MGQKAFKDSSNNSMTMASQLSLKKMIPQLLLSVSIFSFLFSYSSFTSSSYSSTHHHHHESSGFYYYFIANKFQLLLSSYALNKNCLFLICNGLLVLLAKTSGFNIDYHAGFDLDDMLQKKICGDVSMEQLMSEARDYEKTLVDHKYAAMDEEHEEPEQEQEEDFKEKIITEHDQWSNDDGGEGPKEVSIFITDDAEKDHNTEENDQRRSSLWLFDGDEDELLYEEEAVDRGDEQREDKRELSTEELNQKFEEFIRKMKEEIIVSEAQQSNNIVNVQ